MSHHDEEYAINVAVDQDKNGPKEPKQVSEITALKIENLTLRLDAMQKMADPFVKEREALFVKARQELGATAEQTEWNFETRQFQAPKA